MGATPAEPCGLSACIICMDEADRLPACLESVSFCDEVLVVDSHSTDDTRTIARDMGARVIERDWPGFGAQKSFAVGQATHDWVLCVDADETVSDLLRLDIEQLRARGFGDCAGYSFPRRTRYMGKWIRYGALGPRACLRLFDRRRGSWVERVVHESVQLDGERGRLSGALLHDPFRNREEHRATIERYTTLAAQSAHDRGRQSSALDRMVRPAARFVKHYFLKLGFLEGRQGFYLAMESARYTSLKYSKLKALERTSAENQGVSRR